MKRATVTFASLFLLAALATANAKTYYVDLLEPSVVAGTELKAGIYQIDVMDSSIVIKGGKTPITVPATLEKAGAKYSTTSVRYDVSGGKREIKQIKLGNTNLKVVLGGGASKSGAAKKRAKTRRKKNGTPFFRPPTCGPRSIQGRNA